jgi:enamine deaminase RidA (YjgF/YER057c/UK114 family)
MPEFLDERGLCGSVTRRAFVRTLAAGVIIPSFPSEAVLHSPTTKLRTLSMSKIDRRLAELGITLPKPWNITIPANLAASLVRVRGKSVFVSGHVPIAADGSPAGPFGRVGSELTTEQGQEAARLALIGILASLKAELGDLDRIGAWLRVYGMVWGAPGFAGFPSVLNGASRVIHDVFGPEIGNHARVAIGVGATPFNAPLEIEAQLELA